MVGPFESKWLRGKRLPAAHRLPVISSDARRNSTSPGARRVDGGLVVLNKRPSEFPNADNATSAGITMLSRDGRGTPVKVIDSLFVQNLSV